MGPKAKEKLELLKSQLPPKEKLPDNYAADKDRLETMLGQLRGDMTVIYDLCVTQPKEVKEEFIQMILAGNKESIDTVLKLAKDDGIQFSFLGMDTNHDGDEAKLVHPDTAKVEELQEELDRVENWDSSGCTDS